MKRPPQLILQFKDDTLQFVKDKDDDVCVVTFHRDNPTPARLSTRTGSDTGVGPGVRFLATAISGSAFVWINSSTMPHPARHSVKILTNKQQFLKNGSLFYNETKSTAIYFLVMLELETGGQKYGFVSKQTKTIFWHVPGAKTAP